MFLRAAALVWCSDHHHTCPVVVLELVELLAEGDAQLLADPPDADIAASRTTSIRSSVNGTVSSVVIVVIGEPFVAPPVEGRAPSIIAGLHGGKRPQAAGETAPG